jgi:ribonuclease M5
VKKGEIIDVYIPDVFGKERRKVSPGKEGKLGVEGISDELIIEAFAKAGIKENTGNDESAQSANCIGSESGGKITKADLAAAGLSGGANCAERRRELQKKLGLPEHLSANGLLDILNIMMTRDEFSKEFGE